MFIFNINKANLVVNKSEYDKAIDQGLFDSFFKKWANPGLFFVYLCLFKQTLQFFRTHKCEKCPSSIWRQDSNSQPSDYESPPLTTR